MKPASFAECRTLLLADYRSGLQYAGGLDSARYVVKKCQPFLGRIIPALNAPQVARGSSRRSRSRASAIRLGFLARPSRSSPSPSAESGRELPR